MKCTDNLCDEEREREMKRNGKGIGEKGATSCKNGAHSINAFYVHFPFQHLIKYLNFVFI
jgi:hypothetical protein